MISREMTWADIEEEFGPLVEMPTAPDGGWDRLAIESASKANLLWTRVEPGLVSTGFHYVNRECYFRAARPYPQDVDVNEVDDDIGECSVCGDWTWAANGARCGECEGAAHAT